MATSLASGMLIRYLATCIVSPSGALDSYPSSSYPQYPSLLSFKPSLKPFYPQNVKKLAFQLPSSTELYLAAIKAFNATTNENSRGTLLSIASNQPISCLKLSLWYAMMGMLVQGFWFDAKLIRDHNAAAGDVMAVFRACLIATSNLHN